MMLDFAYGRRSADSKASADRAQQATQTIPANTTTAMLALAAASRAWWESRRLQGWTLEQHLADPTAGCDGTEEEQALAKAVAAWLRPSD
jgi:hypothetical protein